MKEMCVSNVKMSPITAELNCPPLEGEKILLSQRQLQRWHLMKMPEVGKIALREAEQKIGVCYQQRVFTS
jgi:hypothetical protein